jgi:hypothetical protein
MESKTRELEVEESFKKIYEYLKKAKWSVPRGFSSRSIREDRDSG